MPTDQPLPVDPPDGIDPLKHQGLVGWVARYYLDRGLDLADLKQEGQFGLLEACERFDPKLGKRFGTYAPYWIRAAIRHALAQQACPIRVPAYLRRQIHNGYSPDSPGLTAGQRANLRAALVVAHGECCEAVEWVAAPGVGDDTGASTEDRVADLADDFANEVAPRLAALTPRERAIIAYSFGLDGAPLLRPRQIATALGLTRQRINQLYWVAIRKLRVALQATGR